MRRKIGALILAVALCCFITACSAENGKSAYEIAVENGFTGTEQQWLASLQGKNGLDGQNAVSLDIYDLYDAYINEVDEDASFADFLNSYLAIDYHDTEYASAKAMCSVVRIIASFRVTSGGFRPTISTVTGAGSGVLYRIDGDDAYIITNYHVVYEYTSIGENGIADELNVYAYANSDAIVAEFVGGSVSKDIAVLKVSATQLPSYMQVATIGGSVTAGMRTVAVGNPLNEGIAVTSGVVSRDSENIEMDRLDAASGTSVMRVIRTDTSINGGNSGGGLFNLRGELVGIVNAKQVSDGVEGMGFAIPTSVATGIANSVIDAGGVKLILGIEVFAGSTSVLYNTTLNCLEIFERVVINGVTAGSVAEGMLVAGDVLIGASINGGNSVSINRIFTLSDYLYNVRNGDLLQIVVERGGQEQTISFNVTSITDAV